LPHTVSLTLTLSRWEREQPLTDFIKLTSQQAEAAFISARKKRRDFVEKLGALLPLPKGEGRGEGKGFTKFLGVNTAK
jgi:hypothetical protein